MAETSSLLNCRTGNRTTSSNLVLSAQRQPTSVAFFASRPRSAISPAASQLPRRGMPSSLRFAGCLPVVASLLPHGTRLMALSVLRTSKSALRGVTRRAPEPPGAGANLVRPRSPFHRPSVPLNRQDETGPPSSKPLLGHVAWFHSPIWAHETRPPSPRHLLGGVIWLHLGGIPSVHCFSPIIPFLDVERHFG